MSSYPILSVLPAYPIKVELEDSVIRSEFEGGYEQTRQKYTRIRRTFTFHYEHMPTVDKEALMDFILDDAHGGADLFTWDNLEDGNNYTVRLAKPPTFIAYIKINSIVYYQTDDIVLREV